MPSKPQDGLKYVHITGPKNRLEELELVLVDSEAHVAETDDGMFLHHPSFDLADSVPDAAEDFLAPVRGLFEIATGYPLNVEVDYQVTYENGAKTVHSFHKVNLTINASYVITVTKEDGTMETSRPTDPVPGWLSKLLDHPHLERALRLFANQGTTWVGLYKVYDALRQHAGDPSTYSTVSNKQLKRFTQTANDFDVIGEEARHGHSRGQGMKHPMTQGEARAMIQTLLTAACQELAD